MICKWILRRRRTGGGDQLKERILSQDFRLGKSPGQTAGNNFDFVSHLIVSTGGFLKSCLQHIKIELIDVKQIWAVGSIYCAAI